MGRGDGVETLVPPSRRISVTPATPRPATELLLTEQTPAWDTLVASVQRVTEKGVPTQLNVYRNFDTYQDRREEAWVTDMIEAHTADGPAGYLKIEYIPQHRFEQYYPNMINWAVDRKGIGFSLREQMLIPQSSWTPEHYQRALKTVGQHMFGIGATERAQWASDDLLQLKKEWTAMQKRFVVQHPDYKKQFQSFTDYHLNKPTINFSRVYHAKEKGAVVNAEVQPDLVAQSDCQRKGIGTLMYHTAAVWMHQRGMQLHASSNQSEKAESVWQSFTEQGLLIDEQSKRKALSGEKLLQRGAPTLSDQ